MEKTSKKSTGTKKQTPSYTQEENNSMLQELFMEELRYIYWAEKHLVNALPKMEKSTFPRVRDLEIILRSASSFSL